ncbi:IclR family transcriptional regulator [Arthrobacter sp. HY1533]|uniref:IclR family transcriptional regulator n=1 Tax=Arthrobacter sp. HY1533 TaxID=2970919 RepID=UPI0022BA0886|nr:IclR family transcriptional regulator C-terminal domain-containing protein [Arthrobacter sp. HY1533]
MTGRQEEHDEKSSPLEKTFAVLEFVAERGGASAKEVSDALGYPMPSVYRLAKALVQTGYLVHLKDQSRFELGYKPHQLAVSLHRQIGVPSPVKAVIAELHKRVGMAAYFAVYRGADVVVAYVVDSPQHPRLTPLSFGFHEAAHATAFGKIMLAGMNTPQRDQYLSVHGTRRLQANTMTDPQTLATHLETVMLDGIAWEHEEFVPGKTCAAVGVHNGAGMVVGSVAVSTESHLMQGKEADVELALRETANVVSKYFRTGR